MPMEKNTGSGSGTKAYNHGGNAGSPGGAKMDDGSANVVSTRLPGGGKPKKGTGKGSSGRKMGMGY